MADADDPWAELRETGAYVRYIGLLRESAAQWRGAAAEQDSQEAGRYRLESLKNIVAAIVEFLRTDAQFAALAEVPMTKLAVALFTLLQGGRPSLLDIARKGGRPSDPAADLLKAAVIHTLDVLIGERGLRRKDAATIVIQILKDLSVPEDLAKNIGPATILRWRDERGARASKLIEDLCRQLDQARQASRRPDATPEQEARALLAAWLTRGF
jgi:hypothetical protein